MVGNSGDVKGIKKEPDRGGSRERQKVPGCQGDYLKGPPPDYDQTLEARVEEPPLLPRAIWVFVTALVGHTN